MEWRLQSISFILINLALLACIGATGKGDCPYTLEVKTSRSTVFHPLAGTKDHVRVRFGDKSKREVQHDHLKEPFEGNTEDPFKAGNTANFNISGSCVEADVCYLYFKVEGTDKWKADRAVVYIEENSFTFHFSDKYMTENSWDGKNYCNAPEQLASTPSDASMYNSTKIRSRPKRVGKTKGAKSS